MSERVSFSPEEYIPVESVSEAAAVIRRLYTAFDAQAPKEKLTDHLHRRYTRRDEGKWIELQDAQQRMVKVPALEKVLRSDGHRLLLEPAFIGPDKGITSKYFLEPDLDYKDGILLAKTGWSFEGGFLDVPTAYIALPDGQLFAPVLDRMNLPVHHAPDFLNRKSIQQVRQVTPQLNTLLREVQSYRE